MPTKKRTNNLNPYYGSIEQIVESRPLNGGVISDGGAGNATVYDVDVSALAGVIDGDLIDLAAITADDPLALGKDKDGAAVSALADGDGRYLYVYAHPGNGTPAVGYLWGESNTSGSLVHLTEAERRAAVMAELEEDESAIFLGYGSMDRSGASTTLTPATDALNYYLRELGAVINQ